MSGADSSTGNPFAACLIGLRPRHHNFLDHEIRLISGHEVRLTKASLVEGERLVRDDIDQGERRRDRRERLVLITQTMIQIRLKPIHDHQPVAR